MTIKEGDRVRVTGIIPTDTQSDEVGLTRIGQEGTVDVVFTYSQEILHSVRVQFDTPDEDGDYRMDFQPGELEVVA